MADPTPDPGPDDLDEPAPPRRRRLDNRSVAICVCIALLAALTAALAVSIFGGGDSSAGSDDSTTAKVGLTEVDPNAPATPPPGQIDGLVGAPFAFADFAGRPVVVNFFSTTCVPCIKEMPDIEQLHQELGDQVEFVGIDVLDTKAKGQGLAESTGVTYRTGWDPDGNVLRDFDGKGLPTTIIIDSKGNVIDAHTGALTRDELRQLLTDNALLGAAPSADVPTTTAPASTPP